MSKLTKFNLILSDEHDSHNVLSKVEEGIYSIKGPVSIIYYRSIEDSKCIYSTPVMVETKPLVTSEDISIHNVVDLRLKCLRYLVGYNADSIVVTYMHDSLHPDYLSHVRYRIVPKVRDYEIYPTDNLLSKSDFIKE